MKKSLILAITFFPLFLFAQEIESGMRLPDLAITIYLWIVKLSGICALLVIVWGGAEYAFFSAAEPAKVAGAKEKIRYAIYGLLIVLLSYILLNLLAPELVSPPESTFPTTSPSY